ncbi:MAG TPA: D-alanine--D-alanine ligase [Flavobacterium sp.]|jgi:hypothetical protein
MKLFFHKLTHWEYWPFGVVYFPVFFQWAYYAIKAKSIFFFNASNPSLKNGGFMAESKKEIYDILPDEYYPNTILIKAHQSFDDVLAEVERSAIKFPLIAKPDIGLRGSAVKKVYGHYDLQTYHQKANFDYLIQALIPYKKEVGIFYVRYPGEFTGKITGIVSKEFVKVVGDGVSTVRELVSQDLRYEMQLQSILREQGTKMHDVLSKGEQLELIPYGNHARGAKFLDGSHLISDTLSATLNTICSRIPDFYFGRLDIMYNDFAKLERGEEFMIVEVNGASSEPTHIYDPKHSIFFAWKELIRHTCYMFEISMANREAGAPFLSFEDGMRQFRIHQEQSRKIISF